ncbi:hypothetical protein [Alicycliphilus denitrificans]|uniref:hypothetical protein n=1 Tax=Alicycliphilus denitrificans TaxID=179636 RepID=UPI00191629F3|nr:hypothetical protein [Alicycliphilus denitrificans]MBN9573492.1 hypothetical protein [Alicycliphilus denitrificans]
MFISEMKLRVEVDNAFFLPDVFVTCAERGKSLQNAPTLGVAVFSSIHHQRLRPVHEVRRLRKLPSLCKYAVIGPEHISVDLKLPIEVLYENVRPIGPERSLHH